MMGYIKIYKNELKIKHIKQYKDMYCQLCTELGKNFGILYRMFVSYDVTFFLSIFDALSNEKNTMQIKCPFQKKSNQISISNKAIEYCLLISIYWIVKKIEDDRTDNEHSLKNLILKCVVDHNKKIKNKLIPYTNIIESWNELMNRYYVSENAPNSSFDMLANNIGVVYGTVFSGYIDFAQIDADKEQLFEMGFNIGVYIYLMDAYDDYFKDLKRKKFNPITKMSNYEKNKCKNSEIKRKVEMLMYILLNKINDAALALRLQDKPSAHIIENIIIFGMKNIYNEITNKKYVEGKCSQC